MLALRIIAPVVTAALGVTGIAATASAAPSSTGRSASVAASTGNAESAGVADDQCRLRIAKVRVLNLQHDVEGVDRAFVNIGNSVTETLSYSIPQTRNTLGTGEELFSGTAQVTLKVEVLDGLGSIVVGSDTVPCRNTTQDFVFGNGDARYKVKAVVEVLR